MRYKERSQTNSSPETELLNSGPSGDHFIQQGDNGVERGQRSPDLNGTVVLDDFPDGGAERGRRSNDLTAVQHPDKQVEESQMLTLQCNTREENYCRRSYSVADLLQLMARMEELNAPGQQQNSVFMAEQLTIRMQELNKFIKMHSIVPGKAPSSTSPTSLTVGELFRKELEDLDSIEEWCNKNKEMLSQLIQQHDYKAGRGHRRVSSETSYRL